MVKTVNRRRKRILVIDFSYTRSDGRKACYRRDAQVQTHPAAELEHRRLLANVAQYGSPFAPQEAGNPESTATFATVANEFLALYPMKHTTRVTYGDVIHSLLLPYFGPMAVDAINSKTITLATPCQPDAKTLESAVLRSYPHLCRVRAAVWKETTVKDGTTMASSVPNLWPDDFAPPPQDDLPVVILRQQATLLGEKTKNLVDAEIRTEAAPLEGPIAFEAQIAHRFLLRAAAIPNYRYGLLTVYQPTDLYPVRIDFEGQLVIANSKEELLSTLLTIFSAESTRKIIGALIAQSAVPNARTANKDR